MSLGQDLPILSRWRLSRAHLTDAAVPMAAAVPVHESGGVLPGLAQRREALGRELRAVLRGAKQRLDEGVVVARAWARVRGLDTPPVQHRPHRSRLDGRAAVAVQNRELVALDRAHAFDQRGAVRCPDRAAWTPSSSACTSQPTTLRLYMSGIRDR